MNEWEARRLYLVRAIELEDAAETVLTREDRQQATGIAIAELPHKGHHGRRTADDSFLARRSDFAFSRVESRFPAVGHACRKFQWPAMADWAVPLGALVLGLATNEIDNGSRLSIIAFPLIGMLVWNLGVYALLAAGPLKFITRRLRSPRAGFLLRLLSAKAASISLDRSQQPALARALSRFAADWFGAASQLTARRLARTLHLAAASLAAGVVAGMYLRALSIEYLAGWESTFINPGTLRNILGVVLGPASFLTGIPLADAEHLQTIRWTSGTGGENAGPWIHLYATTAAIFIIGPRLTLAAGNALAAFRMREHFPIPGREDFYTRRLLRSARGQPAAVQVIPYSFHASEQMHRRLQRVLEEVLGDGVRVVINTAIPYGGEDEWLAGAHIGDDVDHVVLLFNLSSTPEAENQGALVAGLRRRLAENGSGAGLTALLEESAYRQRLAGQPGTAHRLESRRLAWSEMLGPHGVRPLSVDLDNRDLASLARQLEGALIKESALAPKGGA